MNFLPFVGGDPVDLKSIVRDVPGFPKPGIIFKDITPILANAAAFAYATAQLAARFSGQKIDVVVGIESRGFLFGAPIAQSLGVGFAPARKKGKLPYRKRSTTYALEYGEDTIEMHEDAVKPGHRVLIIDDLLATGGTAKACVDLVHQLGAKVAACAFLIELSFLNGRKRLHPTEVHSLVQYASE